MPKWRLIAALAKSDEERRGAVSKTPVGEMPGRGGERRLLKVSISLGCKISRGKKYQKIDPRIGACPNPNRR
jgi:hypothetical protein